MALVSEIRSTGTTATDPLLSYSITTNPDPLKASPENPQAPQETGELLIVASRRSSTPADVQSIRVKVPAGTASPELTTDLTKIVPRITLDKWSVTLDTTTNEFVFTPAAEFETIGLDAGFTIKLGEIPINRKVGSTPITVTERSRTGNSEPQKRVTRFDIGKFPADFYLRNFICDPLVIDNGGEVTLTWERSANATYELLYGDVHDPDVTNITTRDIKHIKSDTTFYIRGTAGDPSNPVVRILSTQVTVRKPDLEIGNLIVNGNITAVGEGKTVRIRNVNITDNLTVGKKATVGDDQVLTHGSKITLQNDATPRYLADASAPTAPEGLVQTHWAVGQSGFWWVRLSGVPALASGEEAEKNQSAPEVDKSMASAGSESPPGEPDTAGNDS